MQVVCFLLSLTLAVDICLLANEHGSAEIQFSIHETAADVDQAAVLQANDWGPADTIHANHAHPNSEHNDLLNCSCRLPISLFWNSGFKASVLWNSMAQTQRKYLDPLDPDLAFPTPPPRIFSA